MRFIPGQRQVIPVLFLCCIVMVLKHQQQVHGSGLKAVGRAQSRNCRSWPSHYEDDVICEHRGIYVFQCPRGFYCAPAKTPYFWVCPWVCPPIGHSVQCADGDFCPADYSCSTNGRQCIPNGAQECGPNGCGSDQICEDGLCVPKEIEQCQRYLDLEKGANCGPDGYLRGYGHRYCTWFFERSGLFNAKGQQFVKCAAKCLLGKMDGEIMPSSANDCAAIRAKAYASHVGCYEQCDVCATMGSGQNMVQYWHTVQLRDIEMGPVAAIAKHCAGQAVQSLYDAANSAAVRFGAYLLTIMPTNSATQ